MAMLKNRQKKATDLTNRQQESVWDPSLKMYEIPENREIT